MREERFRKGMRAVPSLQAGKSRGARQTSRWKGAGLPGEAAGGPVVGWGAVGLLSFCT